MMDPSLEIEKSDLTTCLIGVNSFRLLGSRVEFKKVLKNRTSDAAQNMHSNGSDSHR